MVRMRMRIADAFKSFFLDGKRALKMVTPPRSIMVKLKVKPKVSTKPPTGDLVSTMAFDIG